MTRKITETTREYNDNGALIREIVTETTEEDVKDYPLYPCNPYPHYFPSNPWEITCDTSNESVIASEK